MFYAHFVLSKKGPLARIWLAAHWDKKLTKAHVFETNIEGSVEAIIQPKVKLALRTSGHLLLGVVRIYSRKAKYLLADCNEAFVKIKMAFRPGMVDLPEESKEAAVAAITLPETFHDFETTMADLNDIDVQAQFSVNQSRPEEITMKEDLGNISLAHDDGFGDMGFGVSEAMLQDVHMEDPLFVKASDKKQISMDIDLPVAGPFEDDYEGPAGIDDDDDDDNDADFGSGLDTGLFGDMGFGVADAMLQDVPIEDSLFKPMNEVTDRPEEPASPPHHPPHHPPPDTSYAKDAGQMTLKEQTTLISNDGDAFALQPIDITNLAGPERRAKRRRKLIIDDQKGIPSETMKVQLSDTSDIVTTLDLAPPTKKLMHWKETGGVEKLFALPAKPLCCRKTQQLFNANLVTGHFTKENQSRPPPIESAPEQRVISNKDQPPPKDTARDHSVSIIDKSVNLTDVSVINQSLVSERPSVDINTFTHREPVSVELSTVLRRASSDDDDNDVGGLDEDDIDSMPRNSPLLQLNEELQELPQDEEPLEPGETIDQLEERRWKGRTQQLMHIIGRGLISKDTVSFHDLVRQNNRKQVASKFYTLLVLKKNQTINLEQIAPFGDILIQRGALAPAFM